MSPEGQAGPTHAEPARFLGSHDRTLLSRIEDAGLNASAPPQQRWMDGWLVRTCPGKAQRARCINALAAGRQPVAEKLRECAHLYRSLVLPLLVRITPFTQPPALENELVAAGFEYHDDTRVMVLAALSAFASESTESLPAGTRWAELASGAYAEAVGQLRGSSAEAQQAHASRIANSPVPYRGFALQDAHGRVLACGQIACEGALVGLYDIATANLKQRQGLGTWLCKRLLTVAQSEASSTAAYLQVGADNEAARRIYRRLGFEDAYSYHYRLAPA